MTVPPLLDTFIQIDKPLAEFRVLHISAVDLDDDLLNLRRLLHFRFGLPRFGGDLAQANLLSSIAPVYPPLAPAAGVQGVVVLQVQISDEGRVEDTRVVSGSPVRYLLKRDFLAASTSFGTGS
jgi:hypothetical protein